MEKNYIIWAQQQWDFLMKEKCRLLLWSIAAVYSVMTCHLEAYANAIYPDRKIVLIFWRRKNVIHHCGPSLMVTLSWVVVIYHTIFLTRTVFGFIDIEVKYWWFDMGYRPPYIHIWRCLLSFVLPFQSKTALVVVYMNYTNFHLFLY